jgi:hypothetical protein
LIHRLSCEICAAVAVGSEHSLNAARPESVVRVATTTRRRGLRAASGEPVGELLAVGRRQGGGEIDHRRLEALARRHVGRARPGQRLRDRIGLEARLAQQAQHFLAALARGLERLGDGAARIAQADQEASPLLGGQVVGGMAQAARRLGGGNAALGEPPARRTAGDRADDEDVEDERGDQPAPEGNVAHSSLQSAARSLNAVARFCQSAAAAG